MNLNKYVLHENKIRKNINPKTFLQNAKQEWPCQSLESFSGVYCNMENKIIDFQFEPVLESTKVKQKSSMTDGVLKNGATVKAVKRC